MRLIGEVLLYGLCSIVYSILYTDGISSAEMTLS
jgi:hypothetical protein